jgi:hypothetical protein
MFLRSVRRLILLCCGNFLKGLRLLQRREIRGKLAGASGLSNRQAISNPLPCRGNFFAFIVRVLLVAGDDERPLFVDLVIGSDAVRRLTRVVAHRREQ